VEADTEPNCSFGRFRSISFVKSFQDFLGTEESFESAVKFDKEGITDGFDFSATVSGEKVSDQDPLFFEEVQGKGFVPLSKSTVADDVREH
jgi:hypothetical protein